MRPTLDGLPVYHMYRDIEILSFNGGRWQVWGDGRAIAAFLSLDDARLFVLALRTKPESLIAGRLVEPAEADAKGIGAGEPTPGGQSNP